MTENQQIFCEGVARLCKSANAPEMYRPIIKLWAICEDASQQNTDVIDVDMNKLTPEQSSELQADMANIAKMKEAEEAAKEKTAEASEIAAAKMNEFSRQNEENAQNPDTSTDAGTVNG